MIDTYPLLLVAAFMIALILKAIDAPLSISKYLKAKYMKKISYAMLLLAVVAAVIINIIFFVGFAFGNNSANMGTWSVEGRTGYGFVFVFFNLIAMVLLILAVVEKNKTDQ